MDLDQELQNIVGGQNILRGDDVHARQEDWGRHRPCPARLIVRPASTTEVSAVLALCHDRGQTVVTHGGRTGLAQGAVSRPEDIVLSLERMRGIEHLDPVNRSMTVWAGTPLAEVQAAAADAGLQFALDLGARGTATIGGAVATNAGGLSVIRYGMMREQLLGLEAVLADGTVITSLNDLIKNNSGYDLKQLFIGSEGTLGVVTRAVLRLRPACSDYNTALLATDSYDALVAILHRLDHDLGGGLLAYEVMWRNFYQQVTAPESGRRAPIPATHPYYILVESAVIDLVRDPVYFEELLVTLMEDAQVADAVIAKSAAERQALWELREDTETIFNLGPMINFDISLPLRDIPTYVARVEREVRARWPRALFIEFGHLGDNNLHMSISVGAGDAATTGAVKAIVYGLLPEFRGAVSAEHGVGLEKRGYLPLCRSDAEIALMRRLKTAMDPGAILNPGKILR